MKKPYIIAVSHQKGGVGKSTIAANLAVAFTEMYGDDFEAIDLDTQRSLLYFNNVRKQNGLKPLPIKTIVEDLKDPDKTAKELTKIINSNTKILLVDAGGFDSGVNRILLMGADRIITPVSDSGIELAGLMKFQTVMKDVIKRRDEPVVSTVLLNRVHMFAGKSLEEIYDFARDEKEFDIFNTIIRDRGEIRKAFDEGRGVLEIKDSKAAVEFKQLIKELTNVED